MLSSNQTASLTAVAFGRSRAKKCSDALAKAIPSLHSYKGRKSLGCSSGQSRQKVHAKKTIFRERESTKTDRIVF